MLKCFTACGACAQTAATGFVCGGARSPQGWFQSALGDAGIKGFTWHDFVIVPTF